MAKFEDMAVEVQDLGKSSDLTPKQAAFVREYLVDLNATQAAIRAGYSAKTAQEQSSRLLSNVMVAKHIQAAMDARAKKTGISAEYVINGIVKLIERCEQAVPVLDDEGNPTGEWKFESSSALRGYELLGKHLKLFTDKVEVDVGETLAERIKAARERTIQG